MMLQQVKFVLLACLVKSAWSTYSYNYPSGSTAVYNSGTTAYYQPYTYVSFPAGSRVTYTQACTVYYEKPTTVYGYNGPIYYPAQTHVNYAAGTQMTYAPKTGVWASGSSTTAMRYDQFNGNNYGIANYPSSTSMQTSTPQNSYFAPATPTTNYYNPGYNTQFGASAPYIGYQTYYYTSSGSKQYGYCNGYVSTGYPTYTAGTYSG